MQQNPPAASPLSGALCFSCKSRRNRRHTRDAWQGATPVRGVAAYAPPGLLWTLFRAAPRGRRPIRAVI